MVKTSLSVQKVPCPPRHSGDLSLALRQHVSLCGVIPREHPCGTKMHGRHGDTGEVSGGMICKHGLPNPLSRKVKRVSVNAPENQKNLYFDWEKGGGGKETKSLLRH